jgi:hypothetical protein
MLDSSLKGRSTRAKRREMFWNNISKIVGCSAVVIMVAVVMTIVIEKMLSPPHVDEAYIRTMTGHDAPPNKAKAKTKEEKWQIEPADEAKKVVLNSADGMAQKVIEVETAAKIADAAASPTPRALPVAVGIEEIDAKRGKITQTVEAFFDAKSVEAKLPYVRSPERVGPLMTAFYAREPMPSFKWRGLGWIVSVAERGYHLGYVQALFEDATASSLVIEEMPSGEFRVDWEGFVRYGELAWRDFLRLQPAEPKLLRVIASRPVSNPAGSTAPGSEWLELRHPAESGMVLGFFDKSDPKLGSLLEQMQIGKWKDVPLTLRLCYPTPPTASGQPSVRIAGVEGKGWLILDGSGS